MLLGDMICLLYSIQNSIYTELVGHACLLGKHSKYMETCLIEIQSFKYPLAYPAFSQVSDAIVVVEELVLPSVVMQMVLANQVLTSEL